MLCIDIQQQPYTVIPILLGSYFNVLLCHLCLWSQHDVIMSWLRLTATSNCFPHPYYTYTVTCGVNMMWLCHGWGWQPPQTAFRIHITLSTLQCSPFAYTYRKSLTPLIFRGSVSLVESKWSTRHGWGWQPPQTSSPMNIRHIQSVWVHWYAVLRHTVTALNSYTHPTWLIIWGCSVSLVESKWCDYVMVEADRDVSKFFVQSMLLVWWTIIEQNKCPRFWNTKAQSNTP